jgi:hypothetical protein
MVSNLTPQTQLLYHLGLFCLLCAKRATNVARVRGLALQEHFHFSNSLLS